MLVWNVYFEDFNRNEIIVRNVFELSSTFIENCQKNYKKNKDNKEVFLEELKHHLMYSYWSKCEYEVIISAWPPSPPHKKPCEIKVDIYDQVMLNWNLFSEYVWENREAFKVKRTRKKGTDI